MSRPRLLDLYCGAGGAARGYQMAGFHVTGVDIAPQPRYIGDAFFQAGALEFLADHGTEYDVIHASPPCQAYSIMNNLPWLRGRDYPLLILPTLEMLEALGRPYVLENVMGARHGAKGLRKRGLEAHGLQAGWLCGTMFGLPFYRHRLFATNWFWLAPGHPNHQAVISPGYSRGGGTRDIVFSTAEDARGIESWSGRRGGTTVMATLDKRQNGAQAEGVGVGHAKGWRLAAEAMAISWMKREELTQAIPPIYTTWLTQFLLRELGYAKREWGDGLQSGRLSAADSQP